MAKPLSWGAVPWSFLPAKREPDEAGFVGVPLCGAHSEPEQRRMPQARPWGAWWQSPAPSRQACPTARGRIRRAVFPDGHTPKPGRAGWSWRGGRLPRDPGGGLQKALVLSSRGQSQHPARGAPGPVKPEPLRLAAARSSRLRVATSRPLVLQRAKPKGSRFLCLVTYDKGSGTAGEGLDEGQNVRMASRLLP